MTLRIASFSAFLLLASGPAAASDPDVGGPVFDSGAGRVALIELYTSEGCSSCPPADRWLSGLKADPGLWRDFVPLAFHVDYWDYIGWRDRFAQPEYSQRQRRYAAEGGVPTVYTPGLVKDGREWRGWNRDDSPEPDKTQVGDLSVELEGDTAMIHFDPLTDAPGELTANVAILGMNLTSAVTAGENDGRTLHHDFVVLSLVSRPLFRDDHGFSAAVPLDVRALRSGQAALAAWVSETGHQGAVQAVGGFL